MPGDLGTPYYNDLAAGARDPDLAEQRTTLLALTSDRPRLNPVSVAQLGLAAWERSSDPAWARVALEAAEALIAASDADGSIAYRFPMPHTYSLVPPWTSAMAQGQTASLLVRLGTSLERPDLIDAGLRALGPLLTEGQGLCAATEDGPVLQEYPTSPPAHVLNGWIFALFGLFDGAAARPGSTEGTRAAAAFGAGAETVARRIHLYETWGGWSLYDLFPHPIPHVASPFYHRLHRELLVALDRLAPDPRLSRAAARFEAASTGTFIRSVALARKGAFRIVRPRK